MPMTYRFQRGETIMIALEAIGATSDDIAGVASVGAVLKPTIGEQYVAPAPTPATATFSVTPRVAANGIGPGWDLSIDAATSAAIAPGLYATNAALTLLSGAVEKTEALFIRIEEAT